MGRRTVHQMMVGVGWSVTDAAGTALVAVHAARSNAAHSDAAIHRAKDQDAPTPTII